VRRDDVNVHAERVHVGDALLRRPARLRRQRLPAAADDRDFPTLGILLAAEGVPGAAVVGGAPEALRSHVGVDVDAAHDLLRSGPAERATGGRPPRAKRRRLAGPPALLSSTYSAPTSRSAWSLTAISSGVP